MKFAVAFVLVTSLAVEAGAGEWSMFRGPNASGVTEAIGLPVEFSPEKNLVWKTPLPPGHSSPVFGDDAILLDRVGGRLAVYVRDQS